MTEEESACLVPVPEQERTVDYGLTVGSGSERNILANFHEDALSQTSTGKAQILLMLILGLALAADCAEIKIINFILPAAELHLCIEEYQKGWLVSITLMAMTCGSFVWGVLADHVGRKRALMLALTVATLFSAVATVMPTYGTFMTARFVSGFGTAGIFPIVFTFLAENCMRASRAKYIGMLHSMWPMGALFIAIIYELTMPTLGVDIVQDKKEHWSSWHRFLLLSVLPTFGGILGLLWVSESPRYLLEASREVEALTVYQRMHKLNKTRTQHGLTELELPGRGAYPDRSSSSTGGMFFHGLQTSWETLQKMFSPVHMKNTLSLGLLHAICGFIYMGITTFSMLMMKALRESQYLANKKFVENEHFSGSYNETIENMFFKDCSFKNASFNRLNLIHVNFWNCTVDHSAFVNVKTSVFAFENSVITNSRFIDTDLTDHNFINCIMVNNSFLSLISNCALDFDYNIYVDDLLREIQIGSILMIPVLVAVGFFLGTNLLARNRVLVTFWAITCQTCLGILVFSYSFVLFIIVTLLLQLELNAVLTVVSLLVLEAYPCHIRCSAHGLMRSLFYAASLCAIPIYNALTDTALIFPAIVTALPCFIAASLSLKIQDNGKVLL